MLRTESGLVGARFMSFDGRGVWRVANSMITLHEKLQALFPDDVDGWEISGPKDGRSDKIDVWRRPEPQPTQAELNAVIAANVETSIRDREIKRGFEINKRDVVLIAWIASRTGGGNEASIRAELKTIWDAI